MNQKSAMCFVIGTLIIFTSGCVDEASDGTTMTFTYELWAPLSVFFFGLVAAATGWLIRESFERYGWALLFGGPLLALFFGVPLFFDHAVVSDTSLKLRINAWGHDVEYEDLQLIRIDSEEKSGRRGRKRTVYFMSCERKDGTKAKVNLNNKIAEAAAPYFLERAAEFGVPILNQL